MLTNIINESDKTEFLNALDTLETSLALIKGVDPYFYNSVMSRLTKIAYVNNYDFIRGGRANGKTARYLLIDEIHKYNDRLSIDRVIFNAPATIVIWSDGTKTIVKCQPGDEYNKETGLAMCIAKKYLGNKGNFNEVFKRYIEDYDPRKRSKDV